MFHPVEIEEYHKRDAKPRLEFLASRWALKEALVKASGNTRLSYKDIWLEKPPRIDGQSKPKPILKVSGTNEIHLFEELGIAKDGLHASISHEEEFAVAMVTLEKYEEISL